MFLSLDYVYVPTEDVNESSRYYQEVLGATLEWKVRGMGTIVACLGMSETGPAVLLSGHLEGERPVLVYRVADYAEAVAALRAAGMRDIVELEIPPGPVASFRAEGGQRFAVYELVRPGADQFFAGRNDS